MTAYIKIAVFTYPHEFAVLKLLLEKEGLRFFFQNETVIGIVPFYSNALGGIYLKVHPEDVEQAEEILENFEKGNNLHVV